MEPAVASGWEALSRAAWDEALALLAGHEDDPEALEGSGVAHWWLDDADATFAARERAYRLYRARGDRRGAARVAGALAWDSVLFGGRTSVAGGWISRGERLLKDEPLSSEHAWLAVRAAEVALAAGDPPAAHTAANRAAAIAEELDDDDLRVVAASLEGLALVHIGRVDDGMTRLDEAAVAATAGEVSDLMWIGKVCCNLIAACERVGDFERATEWCAEVKDFATRWELRALFNVCRTQYAGVLMQKGDWREAEDELEAALRVFEGGRRGALVDGTAKLGELRRMQGRLDEARRLFDQASGSWTARVGRVELALDEDDAESAFALAETLERETSGSRHLDRVSVLALVCRAAASGERIDTVVDAERELVTLAAEVGTGRARAVALRASGELALARGDLEGARRDLEDAVPHAHSPHEQGRIRLSLARVLHALGFERRAVEEAQAAAAAFDELAAAHDTAAAKALLAELDGRQPDGLLTRREREVLVLVAAGRSNPQIARELVLSEHTVHRHVANILRKLGEPTRAAAAARATRDGLA